MTKDRYNLVVVDDTNVSLGIPVEFTGKLFVDVHDEPRRSFFVNVEQGRAAVTEMHNAY